MHPPEETEESSWNQNNLPNTSQSKRGGVSHVTRRSDETDVTKNTNITQNSNEELSNNGFVVVANGNESCVMHINPNDTKNFDHDLDHSNFNKILPVPGPQTQGQSFVRDNVQVQTKSEDNCDINDFQNWLNGTSNFGMSSRHDLCYSEADISMAFMNPRSSSQMNDKKSVSLEIIPPTNGPKANNTSSMFENTLSPPFNHMDNCVELNESSGSSSASSDLKREGHETNAQGHMGKDTDINPDEDNSRLSDNDKLTFNRSSYKLAMYNNDDFTLNDFFSASVEALAALDATLADTPLDTGHGSDTSDSFKSSSDNMSHHVIKMEHERPSKDNDQPITDQGMGDKNLPGDKESDYVEMTSPQGKVDEKTSIPGIEPLCIEASTIPKQENYSGTTLFPSKREDVETAVLSDNLGQEESTYIPLEHDYIDMTAGAAADKHGISDSNALHDKQDRDRSNNLPFKQVEKIRLRCKRVDSDTSSSSSLSSSSECDSEDFRTPQESTSPDSIVEVLSNQTPVIRDITQDIAFIDTDSDAEVNTNENKRTTPVYF